LHIDTLSESFVPNADLEEWTWVKWVLFAVLNSYLEEEQ